MTFTADQLHRQEKKNILDLKFNSTTSVEECEQQLDGIVGRHWFYLQCFRL